MIEFLSVTDRSGLEQAWAVRHRVFVLEQGVPLAEEIDTADYAATTFHLLALRGGVVVGTGRVLGDGPAGTAHIGRVAVVENERGRGTGAALMAALEQCALRECGAGEPLEVVVELSAQEGALGFYRRLGYRENSGERYLDAGIWHRDMSKSVSA